MCLQSLPCRSLSKSHNFPFWIINHYSLTTTTNTCNPLTNKLLYPRLSTWGWPKGLEQRHLRLSLLECLRTLTYAQFMPNGWLSWTGTCSWRLGFVVCIARTAAMRPHDYMSKDMQLCRGWNRGEGKDCSSIGKHWLKHKQLGCRHQRKCKQWGGRQLRWRILK